MCFKTAELEVRTRMLAVCILQAGLSRVNGGSSCSDKWVTLTPYQSHVCEAWA